ncbi:MAG: MgtC/SapB family protein, partial [Betaproteobacteria bacterium]
MRTYRPLRAYPAGADERPRTPGCAECSAQRRIDRRRLPVGSKRDQRAGHEDFRKTGRPQAQPLSSIHHEAIVTALSYESLAAYWSAPAVATNVVVFLNLLGAMLLGLLVGYERSYHGRAAGMRTYGLVCMASAALTVIAVFPAYWYGGHVDAELAVAADPTRIIQG